MPSTKSVTTPTRDVLSSLPRVDRHQPKGALVRPSKVSRWRAIVLILVHVVIGVHILHWLTSGETVTPVEPSEAMQTFELGRINAGFLLFVTLIGSTLVFGRWFCGWACHVVALQDLSAWLLGRLGLRPKPVRSRLLVLAPWAVAGLMFAWPLIENALWPAEKPLPQLSEWRLELTTSDLWATFPGPIMAVGTFVVVGCLIVWWLGAKGFCTYGCPYGAFFAVADRFAPVRIKVNDACEACGHCTSVCTSNVRVHEEVAKHGQIVDPGCMKCLDCVSVCPKQALSVGFTTPKPFAVSQQRIRARADFTWPEELLLAAVALAAFWSFRGVWFGEYVPLLMAVGIGVITAVLALLLLRLLRRPDVAFQHAALKVGGRRSGRGQLVAIGCALWLGLTAHTAASKWWRGELIDAVGQIPAQATPAEVEAVLAQAQSAHRWDLVDDPVVGELKGLLFRRLGRHVESEAALQASYRAQGSLQYVEANLCLVTYCMDPARRRFDQAQELLNSVLTQHPGHAQALQLQEYLERLPR